MTVTASTSFHNVKTIKASSTFTSGMPLQLKLSDGGPTSDVTIFLGDEALVRRLIDAINGAAEAPATKPCPHEDAAYNAARTAYCGEDQ